MTKPKRFAVCVNNEGYTASLDLRKVYEVVDDEYDEQHGMLRVIDESGEDYGFGASRFVVFEVPADAEARLVAAIETAALAR